MDTRKEATEATEATEPRDVGKAKETKTLDGDFVKMLRNESVVASILNDNEVIENLTGILNNENGNALILATSPSNDEIEQLLSDFDLWDRYTEFLINLPDDIFKLFTTKLHLNSRGSNQESLDKAIWKRLTEDTDIVMKIAKVNDTHVSCEPVGEDK